MPIYEYRCERGHTFEVTQRMSDDPVTVCEVCGKPVQRVFHPVAVHFKGSGFYNTDYGKKSKGAAASSDGSAPKSDSKPSESKSDSSASGASGGGSSDSKGSSSSGKGSGSGSGSSSGSDSGS